MLQCQVNYNVVDFEESCGKLLRIFSNLEKGTKTPANRSGTLYNAIADLFEYSRNDLQSEEEEMEEKGYPNAEEHRKEHEHFRSSVNCYLSLMQFGNLPPAEEMMGFLENWIVEHVVHSDRNYRLYLKAKAA